MKRSFVVVDDFYENPDQIRAWALAQEYQALPNSTYPGKNSLKVLYSDKISQAVSQVTNTPLAPSKQLICGIFRSSPGNSTFEQDVHVDPNDNECEWAGVLYLNTPEQCLNANGDVISGTITYQHKRLGWYSLPNGPLEAAKFGFTTYEQIRKEIIYGDGLDRSKWNIVNFASMKYNRLVMFRPTDWHSHGENFGDTLQNSRLVQIFFWRKVE